LFKEAKAKLKGP